MTTKTPEEIMANLAKTLEEAAPEVKERIGDYLQGYLEALHRHAEELRAAREKKE